jgi:hypothetical protein
MSANETECPEGCPDVQAERDGAAEGTHRHLVGPGGHEVISVEANGEEIWRYAITPYPAYPVFV